MREIQYAIRVLMRSRGLSLAAILVLALGIGANSAIFTVVRAVLLAPLPYQNPDRLVSLYEREVVGPSQFNVVSPANFFDWQRQASSFQSMGLYADQDADYSPRDGGLNEKLTGVICDPGFFRTLGASAALGRVFRADDDRPDAARVVVISHAFWRRFQDGASVLGSAIRVEGEARTVIGVMPGSFDFPSAGTEIWLPAGQMLKPGWQQLRGNHRFSVVARLRPGVSVVQARTELDSIARRIKQQYPGELTGKGANVALLADRMVSRVRPMLLVLFGAVACVLLIACVNVGNLLLARAVAARREVAVRSALGASRLRIARQFLIESLLLSLAGAALGIVLAEFGTEVLIKMAGYIPRIDTVRVNGQVLAFTAALAIVTGIAAGLVPAWTASLGSLTKAMQDGGRSATAGRGGRLFRDGLIAAEVALSLMLLTGAGLMLKSFTRLHSLDPGFRPDRVLTIDFSLPERRYDNPARVAGFYRDLLARVRATPGVESAGLVTVAPLGGHFMDTTFTIEGRPPLPAGQFLDAVVRSADPNYFQAAGIPLKRGRVFTAAEWLDAANKAVITESMASTFFPNEEPLGKYLRLSDKLVFEIVGIVGDTRQKLASAPEPMMYFPIYHGTVTYASLLVRATGDPNSLSLPVQKQMRGIDPDLPAITVRTMDERMWGSTEQNRFGLILIAVFAILAVILAAIGLYGVLAYSVGRRKGELGVRMALGADAPDITKLVLLQGLKPALAGVALGIGGGLAAANLIRTLLFEVSPNDPAVIAAVAVLLVLISLVACCIPAWRATRIDPATALRSQ
ncbi:MAG TPA: ABC transporter permease [Candidatus Sulfopaludibacter sp.]|jgi:putative ABC transport system permease protein|nr:ABC transporter permease [Candidatus Sulfopaludibacter sp.]